MLRGVARLRLSNQKKTVRRLVPLCLLGFINNLKVMELQESQLNLSAIDQFKDQVTHLLGAASVVGDRRVIEERLENTLNVRRVCPLIVYPTQKEQLPLIIEWARHFGIPLYPLSCGQNIGYGQWAPPADNQVIVSLEKLNRIFAFDGDLGHIEVEPGVTQIQLADFLRWEGDAWMADMTGAPPKASVLGNLLEAGFGHSPLGDRRNHILEMEVVLGNGHTFRTGVFPDLGPNLSSLFVQSNFGIVTSVKIPLLKKNKHAITYTVQFDTDQELLDSVPSLRDLRLHGLLPSSIHLANSTRVLMSTQRFPESVPRVKILSEKNCLDFLKVPLIRTSLWMGVGAIYGTKGQVAQTKKEIALALKKHGRVSFYSERKVRILKQMAKVLKWFSETGFQKAQAGLESLESLHSLSLGRPSEKPEKNILWRQRKENLGLYWISPVLPAKAESLKQMLDLVRPIFEKYKFEMPLTITYLDKFHFVCVLNINFNKNQKEERVRALRAYREIVYSIYRAGFKLYRKGVRSQAFGIRRDRKLAIQQLKIVWDPRNIIAPGRYGLNLVDFVEASNKGNG